MHIKVKDILYNKLSNETIKILDQHPSLI